MFIREAGQRWKVKGEKVKGEKWNLCSAFRILQLCFLGKGKGQRWKVKGEKWNLCSAFRILELCFLGKGKKGERWKVKSERWKVKVEKWKVKGERWKGERWKVKRWKVKGERWKVKRWKVKGERWNLCSAFRILGYFIFWKRGKGKGEKWKVKACLPVGRVKGEIFVVLFGWGMHARLNSPAEWIFRAGVRAGWKLKI